MYCVGDEACSTRSTRSRTKGGLELFYNPDNNLGESPSVTINPPTHPLAAAVGWIDYPSCRRHKARKQMSTMDGRYFSAQPVAQSST
jgi:hypothetical protein